MRHHSPQTFHESIEHHAPVVHHYVSVEHNGLHSPLQHLATRVPHVVAPPPVYPKAMIPTAKKVSPWDKIKSAAHRITHMGKKSTGAVTGSAKSLKQSEKAARLANHFNAIDEAQKAITNRHLV